MNRLNTVGCFSLYGEPKRYRDCTLIIYSYLDNVTSPSISNRAQSSNHTDFFILDFAPKIIRVQPFQSIPILNWKKFEILNVAFLLQRIVNLISKWFLVHCRTRNFSSNGTGNNALLSITCITRVLCNLFQLFLSLGRSGTSRTSCDSLQ